MATNLYFNNEHSNAEQELINSLNREVIQLHGINVYYLPRTLVKEDLVLGEDVLSKFEVAYEVEMYLKSTEAFGGEGDLVSKFGLDIRDEVIFTVNRERFETATTKFGETVKPLEGDLIYLPMSNGLFEIKFVEHEQPFYQSGKNYSFDLTCELFQYSEEQFDTDVVDVDNIEKNRSAAIDLVMSAGGTGTFAVDEWIFQGVYFPNATFKGRVASWVESTRVLRVNDTSGGLLAAENVKGQTSGAIWSLSSTTDSTGKVDLDQELPTTPFADNKQYELEADSILDFSESNPFGDVR